MLVGGYPLITREWNCPFSVNKSLTKGLFMIMFHCSFWLPEGKIPQPTKLSAWNTLLSICLNTLSILLKIQIPLINIPRKSTSLLKKKQVLLHVFQDKSQIYQLSPQFCPRPPAGYARAVSRPRPDRNGLMLSHPTNVWGQSVDGIHQHAESHCFPIEKQSRGLGLYNGDVLFWGWDSYWNPFFSSSQKLVLWQIYNHMVSTFNFGNASKA